MVGAIAIAGMTREREEKLIPAPQVRRSKNSTIHMLSEAYWVLFRFLYGGQLTDPVLIIACDNLLWGSVA